MCGGAREEPKRTLDLSIFDKSKHFCTMRKGSPFYRKKIRKADKRIEKNLELVDKFVKIGE